MRRTSFALALACTAIFGMSVVGQAQADPLNDGTRTITLFNCTGPTGTPETFQGVKESPIVTSLHLVNSTAVFIPVSLTQVSTGQGFEYQGFTRNGRSLVTCTIRRPADGELFVMKGFFTGN